MRDEVAGVLLAGGLARRLGGGDKGLRTLGGKAILSIIIDRIENQVGPLILNANGDGARFSDYKLPVVEDIIPSYAGPLAGILTGLEWVCDNHPDIKWMVSIPTDAPFIPLDLVKRLQDAVVAGADMACAMSKNRPHPVVGIWPVSLSKDLRHAMIVEDIRKVDRWTQRYNMAHVAFGSDLVDPFFNANKTEDLVDAEKIYQRLKKCDKNFST